MYARPIHEHANDIENKSPKLNTAESYINNTA